MTVPASLIVTVLAVGAVTGVVIWALATPLRPARPVDDLERIRARRRAADALRHARDRITIPAPTWLAELDPSDPTRDAWERLTRTRDALDADLETA